MAELQMYINCFMPFGTPSDTSVPNIKSIKRFGFPSGLQTLTDLKAHDTTRHDTTRHDTTRHDTTRHAHAAILSCCVC
jgi:hypothetical protein